MYFWRLSITGERVDAVEWVTVLPEIVQVRQVMFGEHRENGEFKENALGEKDCSWSDRRSNFRFLVDGCATGTLFCAIYVPSGEC